MKSNKENNPINIPIQKPTNELKETFNQKLKTPKKITSTISMTETFQNYRHINKNIIERSPISTKNKKS